MQIELNKELLKNIYFWAAAIPLVLSIWTLFSLLGYSDTKNRAERKIATLEQVEDNALDIYLIKRKMPGSGLAEGELRPFMGKKSAYACAKLAGIDENHWTRGESSSAKKLKDGSLLHRETYKLTKVRLLQIVQFIDNAELRFSNVSCPNFSLAYARTKSKDSWDATINLEYLITM